MNRGVYRAYLGKYAILLFPLNVEILHRRKSLLLLILHSVHSEHQRTDNAYSNDTHCVSYPKHSDCLHQNGIS